MLQNYSFSMPTRMEFGPGAVKKLPDILAALGGSRVMLVTDPGVAQAGLLEKIINQGCCGGLAVRTGNADLAGGVVPSCELYLRDHMNPLVLDLLHDGDIGRYAGAFHHFVSIEDQFLSMLALLEGNLPFVKGVHVLLGNGSLVGQEHIESFHFSENCRAYSAFRSTENNYSCHFACIVFFLFSPKAMYVCL